MKFSILPLFIVTTEAFHITYRSVHNTGRLQMVHSEQNIGSGMQLPHVQMLIDKIDENNYAESLKMIEPFLLNEANKDEYQEAMRKLNRKAHHLGIEIPHDFASDKFHQPPFSLHGGDESMDKTAGSGMQLQHVDLLIDHLSKDNFETSLDTIEPFLLNEADDAFVKDALQRIESKASAFGKSIPEDYGEKTDRLSP